MAVTVKLHQRNLVSANDYDVDGIYHFQPYDLTLFGAEGAAVRTREGKRYVWITSPDHPNRTTSYSNSEMFGVGYSDDPGVPPSVLAETIVGTVAKPYPYTIHSSGTSVGRMYHCMWLMYNPDDAAGKPFYLYGEGTDISGPQYEHYGTVLRSSDLLTWDNMGPTHDHPASPAGGFTGFQRCFRRGAGDFWSVGPNYHSISLDNFQNNGLMTWSSTDGLTYTCDSRAVLNWSGWGPGRVPNQWIAGRTYNATFGPFVTISGTVYGLFREDCRAPYGTEGMFVTLCPFYTAATIDNLLAAGPSSPWMIDSTSPNVQRLTAELAGNFPSLDYIQDVYGYAEDGIYHFWSNRGFYSDSANPGIGIADCYVDYYTFIYDSTAAATAAPVGFRGECRYNAVVLQWYDALPAKTYRLYRSTDGATWGAAIADVTGLQYVDALTPTTNAFRYYKLVTMSGGVEQTTKFRTLKVYVSTGRELTNKHVARVHSYVYYDTLDATASNAAAALTAADAAVTTINVGWLDTCVGWLTDNGLIDECLHWVDPSFGVYKNGSNQVLKCFCLGTTIHPSREDYTPNAAPSSAVTWSATAMSGTVPAMVNTATGFGSFGYPRYNNMRRKVFVSMAAVYEGANTTKKTFIHTGQFSNFIELNHGSGTPGTVEFKLHPSGASSTSATKAAASATATNVLIGTFDGLNARVFLNGVEGTASTIPLANQTILEGRRGYSTDAATSNFYAYGSDTIGLTITASGRSNDVTRTFSSNQAASDVSTLAWWDKDLTPAQALSFYTLQTTRIGGASYSLPSYSVPLVKNIKTDYSAAGNNSTNDSAAFGSFRTAATNYNGLAVLMVPPGTYLFSTSAQTPFKDIPRLLVVGEDRDTSILRANTGVGGYRLGSGEGMAANNALINAHLNTCTVGATTVAITTADVGLGYDTRFTAGDWVLVSGVCLQEGPSFPTNPQVFEFKKIASRAGGSITFTAPLEYSYKSTWPDFPSVGGEIVQGGAAMIHRMSSAWDCEHEYLNLSFSDQDSQISTFGRFQTYTRCATVGGGALAGIFPSMANVWRANDLNHPDAGGIEVDKLTNKAIFDGGIIRSIDCQSASVNELVLRGGCMITPNNLVGTPSIFYADGFYVEEFQVGPHAYGVGSRAFACQGTVGTINTGGIIDGAFSSESYTMTSGVISTDHSHPITWAVPGARVFFRSGAYITMNSFDIADIAPGPSFNGSSDCTMLITTNLPGNTVHSFPASPLQIQTTPATVFGMRNVSGYITGGGAPASIPVPLSNGIDLSAIEPPWAPQYSRSTRTYSAINIYQGHNDPITIWGQLVSITITIPNTVSPFTPYTGAQTPLLLNVMGQFGTFVVKPDGTAQQWNPQINLRTAGTRTITPAGVTGSVAGDANLDFTTALSGSPAAIWFGRSTITQYMAFDPGIEDTASNNAHGPSVTITIVTDQSPMTMTTETVAPPTVSTHLRLRMQA